MYSEIFYNIFLYCYCFVLFFIFYAFQVIEFFQAPIFFYSCTEYITFSCDRYRMFSLPAVENYTFLKYFSAISMQDQGLEKQGMSPD